MMVTARRPLTRAETMAAAALLKLPAADRARQVPRTAQYWGLRKDQINGLLLVRWLIGEERIGKDDLN